jgi:GGDEF domain-containing protein
LRSTDVLARYGSERFAALLVQAGLSEAELVANRLRERLAAHQFEITSTEPEKDASPLLEPVTLSVALTVLRPQETWTGLLERALALLGGVKSKGPGGIVVER